MAEVKTTERPYTNGLMRAVRRWREHHRTDLRAIVMSDLDIVATDAELEGNEYAQARRDAVNLLVAAGDDDAFFSERYDQAYPDPPLPLGVIPRKPPPTSPPKVIIHYLDKRPPTV